VNVGLKGLIWRC